MDRELLKDRLVDAARNAQESDHVPYAFEKRIMGQISDLSRADPMSLWGRALMRSAAVCFAFALALGALSGAGSGSSIEDEYSYGESLEMAMLEAIPEATELW